MSSEAPSIEERKKAEDWLRVEGWMEHHVGEADGAMMFRLISMLLAQYKEHWIKENLRVLLKEIQNLQI